LADYQRYDLEEPGVSVNDPCVSISTGTLSPDLRVNYAYGMILGLGEFLQEQQYFLQKDYLHERALHGFGTVYGLQVTTSPTPDVQHDYTIAVAPGMAIDQRGREAVVRSAQCARLGAWLGAQEQANAGTIAANMGPSGEFTVYVVLGYDQCKDDLVPLPGQPCSSSAQSMVASRLRDAWNIDLRWSPPPMPAWDTDRRLARLLGSVQIVPGLDPALSSEDKIIAAVRALPSDVGAGPDDLWPLVDWPSASPPSSPPAPVVYWLPAETAADALDRIFTIWVTQVRPQLAPDLTQPSESSDPAILLASITFTLGPVTLPPTAEPALATCDPPDDHGRPYVLHTRLIQELRLLAESATPTEQPLELATLTSDVDDQRRLILTAWFHLDQPVALTEPVQVVSRSGVLGSFDPSAPADPNGVTPQFSDVWILTQKSDFPVIDRDQVAVLFVPGSVLVGDPATTLAGRIAQGLDLLDTRTDGRVVVYGTVDLPPPPPRPVRPLTTAEFVTITPKIVKPPIFEFEFWFHPQPKWSQPQGQGSPLQVFVSSLPPVLVELVDETTGQLGLTAVPVHMGGNVWQATCRLRGQDRAAAYYFRFVFYTEVVVPVNGDQRAEILEVTLEASQSPPDSVSLPIVEWMEKAGFTFLNWDPDQSTITAYLRVAGLQ
jgi:hypothetical protein